MLTNHVIKSMDAFKGLSTEGIKEKCLNVEHYLKSFR